VVDGEVGTTIFFWELLKSKVSIRKVRLVYTYPLNLVRVVLIVQTTHRGLKELQRAMRIFFCGVNSGERHALVFRLEQAKVSSNKSRDFKSRCEGALDEIASVGGDISAG
jgi:hypothetical protein